VREEVAKVMVEEVKVKVVEAMVVAGREEEGREVVEEVREVRGWVEAETPKLGAWAEGCDSHNSHHHSQSTCPWSCKSDSCFLYNLCISQFCCMYPILHHHQGSALLLCSRLELQFRPRTLGLPWAWWWEGWW
jgi:hypothetical protein